MKVYDSKRIKEKEIRRTRKMFEEVSFTMYSVYTDYEDYCRKQNANGEKPVSFFKYAFGQF